MTKNLRLFHLGWIIILLGALLAHFIQTSGGIKIRDIRFNGTGGQVLSGLLYIPPGVTPDNKAPGILAVHGYFNSRETQDGFAIEFARRGYVVLALDQTGHGYSDNPTRSNGFGGPAGLAYLRSLDIVDTNNIGLEGHSMGGWTVLAAAAAMPDAYKALVLEGSGTGKPFSKDGDTTWPRNMAVVFAQYDEFPQVMWGVGRALDVPTSDRLKAAFGTTDTVEIGKVYGSIAEGTGRVLYQPNTTHPGVHFSTAAIGDAISWFGQTLEGGSQLPIDDQIWYWKEIGTLVALVGLVILMAGTFQLLLSTQAFASLRGTPTGTAYDGRGAKWWLVFALSAFIPVLSYFQFYRWGAQLLPPTTLLPQHFTNQIAFWAVLNGAIVFLIGLVLKGRKVETARNIGGSILIALATVGIAYVFVQLTDFLFKVDFRFWVVALKPFDFTRALYTLVYLLPFTVFFVLALRGLHTGLSVAGDSPFVQYVSNVAALILGFIGFLALQYLTLYFTGAIFTPTEPLTTVIAIQFVPLLAIVGFLSTFTYRRTGSYLPGAFICALFVTWYIVAGQAFQAAV